MKLIKYSYIDLRLRFKLYYRSLELFHPHNMDINGISFITFDKCKQIANILYTSSHTRAIFFWRLFI